MYTPNRQGDRQTNRQTDRQTEEKGVHSHYCKAIITSISAWNFSALNWNSVPIKEQLPILGPSLPLTLVIIFLHFFPMTWLYTRYFILVKTENMCLFVSGRFHLKSLHSAVWVTVSVPLKMSNVLLHAYVVCSSSPNVLVLGKSLRLPWMMLSWVSKCLLECLLSHLGVCAQERSCWRLCRFCWTFQGSTMKTLATLHTPPGSEQEFQLLHSWSTLVIWGSLSVCSAILWVDVISFWFWALLPW